MYENINYLRGGKFISKVNWRHITREISTTEIIIVLSGEVKIFIGDKKYHAMAGEVLKIPPYTLHGGYEDSESASFIWIHFDTDTLEGIPKTHSIPANFERVQTLAKELLHYANTAEYPRVCADSLLKVLLAEITIGVADKDTKVISEIKEYIKRNRESAMKASEIANEYNYNEDYLNRLFKQHLGISLKKYIDSTRLEGIKCDLLMSDITLEALSQKYGFEDYKYFLKFFKYHEGLSPTQYRSTYYSMHTNSK